MGDKRFYAIHTRSEQSAPWKLVEHVLKQLSFSSNEQQMIHAISRNLL